MVRLFFVFLALLCFCCHRFQRELAYKSNQIRIKCHKVELSYLKAEQYDVHFVKILKCHYKSGKNKPAAHPPKVAAKRFGKAPKRNDNSSYQKRHLRTAALSCQLSKFLYHLDPTYFRSLRIKKTQFAII